MSFGGAVKLKGEGEYKRALEQITQNLKELGAEMKITSALYDKNDKSTEALTARSTDLTKKLELQSKNISTLETKLADYTAQSERNRKAHEALTEAYDKEKKELERIGAALGKDSQEYKEQAVAVQNLANDVKKSTEAETANEKAMSNLRITINKAKADYISTSREVDKLNDEIEESKKAANDAQKPLDNMGKEVKSVGDQSDKSSGKLKAFENASKTAFKAVGTALAGAAAAIGASTVAASKKLLTMAQDTAQAGDEVDKMSQKLGMSAKSYQEWDYVMSQSGIEIESLKTGFRTLTNQIQKANDGDDKAVKNFKKLGLSLDDLKTKSKEEIFKQAITGLQSMKDSTERAALANQILGKSGQELAPLLNSSAASTEELMKKAHDLGLVMSDEAVDASVKFTDSLDTLKRTFAGTKNGMTSSFLPGLTKITDGLTALISGTGGAKEKLKAGAKEITDAVKKMLPQILTVGETLLNTAVDLAKTLAPKIIAEIPGAITQILSSFSDALPELLPTLFDAAFDLIDSLFVDGLPKLLDSLTKTAGVLLDRFLEKLPELFNKIIDFIGKIDLGKLLDQFLKMVEKITKTVSDNLPTIIEKLMNTIVNLIKSIDWKELIAAGNRILMSMLDGLLKAIPVLIDALPELIDAIIDFLTDPETILEIVKGAIKMVGKIIENIPKIIASLVKAIGKIGRRLIEGLWEGIKNAGNWLKEKISGFFGGIVDNIKGFFGIHSPSALFRDMIGKNLVRGLAKGITDETKTVKKAVNKLNKEIAFTMEGNLVKDVDFRANAITPPQYRADWIGDVTRQTRLEAAANEKKSINEPLAYNDMVKAFETALGKMKIELDDEVAGHFVEETVERVIYA